MKDMTQLTDYEEAQHRIKEAKAAEWVTYLNLSGLDIDTLPPEISELTKLTELDLRGTQITDVEPLRTLTNLKWLYLFDTPISDAGPLNALAKLKVLDLEGTQIDDIEPLSALTKLTLLDLSGSQITSVKPLRDLTNLTKLYLNGTPITEDGKEVLREMRCKNPYLTIWGVDL